MNEIKNLHNETRKGVIALIFLSLVFASMGIFSRYLSTSFALFEQTYLRIGLAFIIGVIIFSKNINIGKLKTLPKKDFSVLIFRAISLYIGVVLFTEALIHANYANVSFIAVLPLLPIFGYVFLKERLSMKTILYIGIGFIGMLFIVLPDFSNFTLGYGEMTALLSVLAFDFSYISRRWHSEHLNDKESTVLMFAFGTIFLFITSYLLQEPLPVLEQFTPIIIGTLVVAALFNVANLYLINYGFSRVKAGVAGNILTLETIFAFAYSVLLFREIPKTYEFIGGVLILLSVYLVNKSER